jgi:predicted ester cyclase
MEKLAIVKQALNQLFEIGNLTLVNTYFDENYVAHSGEKTYYGHKFILQFAKQIRTAIPDIKIQKCEFLSENDNVLTVQKTFSGTHRSPLKGIPASGKKVKWYEISVVKFNNDKIIEEWVVSDLAAQLMLKLKSGK